MRSKWFRPLIVGCALSMTLGMGVLAGAQSLPEDTLVDVMLKDAPLTEATRMLTARTGLQFVIEPSAEPFGKVSLQLTGQKASDVIKYMCQAAGAYFRRDDNGVYIISRTEPSSGKASGGAGESEGKAKSVSVFRRFRLQKADPRDVYMQLLNINPYDVAERFKEMNYFSDVTSPERNAIGSFTPVIKAPEAVPVQRVGSNQVFQPGKVGTESGNDILIPGESAKQFGGGQDEGGGGGFGGQGGGGLGGGGGQGNQGSGNFRGGFIPPGIDLVTFDPTDNSLLVQGTEEAIAALQRMIGEFDRAPKQVEIKVEFVTTQSTLGRSLGYDISFQRGSILFNSSFAASSSPFFLAYSTGNLAFRLRTLLDESRGHSVQAPTIRTMNNQPASITAQTTTTLFLTQIQATPAGNITTVNPTPFTARTQLAVTPRINNDGTITMFLAPQIADFGQIRHGPNGTDIPDLVSQGVSVVARVRNGETIALGGLNKKNDLSSFRRYPVLSEIPIIGQFFRTRTTSRNDTELIIFVTPTIIEDDEGPSTNPASTP